MLGHDQVCWAEIAFERQTQRFCGRGKEKAPGA